jgi:hypothetical protein
MLKRFSELKNATKEKDLDAPQLSVKGWLPQNRFLSGKFPAAEGVPLVLLNLAQLKNHRFEITESLDQSAMGDEAKTYYTLSCISMYRRGEEFEIAEFSDRERAIQALASIDSALHSKKKLLIGASVIALSWMILFMPLPGGAPQARQSPISASPLAMPRLPMQMAAPQGLGSIPSLSSLPLPSVVPGVSEVPGAAPILSNKGAPITDAGNDEDPFGLKIGPNGGPAVGQLQK